MVAGEKKKIVRIFKNVPRGHKKCVRFAMLIFVIPVSCRFITEHRACSTSTT